MWDGMLHHLELYVRDLEVSAAFWGWLLAQLGLDPYEEWDEGIGWRHPAGGPAIVLVVAPEGARDLDRRSVGLNHVAFSVPTQDDVDELTRLLEERGEKILYPDRHPHAGGSDHYAVFVEDPDGLKVEVVAADVGD